MKSIVVGFSDTEGREEPILIHGPAVPDSEQWETFLNAKQKHIYPKGIKRVEILRLERADIAIFVSETAAQERQDFVQMQADAIEARKKFIAKKAEAAADLKKAKENQAKSNIRRAQAQTSLTTATQRLADSKANAEFSKSKTNDARLAHETEAFSKAEKEFNDADEAWTKAKSVLAELTAPKPVAA